MSAQVASVVTLTAEVRTLMIGSRQVTLSVAKQLDRIPLPQLTVWGRIHIGYYDGWGDVIGAAEDGTLARAGFQDRLAKEWVDCKGWLTAPLDPEERAVVDAHLAHCCLHYCASTAPLIILAGLR
jgi:hypothetical protein